MEYVKEGLRAGLPGQNLLQNHQRHTRKNRHDALVLHQRRGQLVQWEQQLNFQHPGAKSGGGNVLYQKRRQNTAAL